jgi:hypothetical protein
VTTETIHVAYAVSRKGGTCYRARAYVARPSPYGPIKHTYVVSIDDDAIKAVANAVKYVRDAYRRDGLEAPSNLVDHGKLSAASVDHHIFPSNCWGPRP